MKKSLFSLLVFVGFLFAQGAQALEPAMNGSDTLGHKAAVEIVIHCAGYSADALGRTFAQLQVQAKDLGQCVRTKMEEAGCDLDSMPGPLSESEDALLITFVTAIENTYINN